jgi:hypothetical protein
MIYSDTYAVLALAAANTSRIRLGPGVADAQETAALRDFNVAYVGCGSRPCENVFLPEKLHATGGGPRRHDPLSRFLLLRVCGQPWGNLGPR